MNLEDYQVANRKIWQARAKDYIAPAEKAWHAYEAYWGIWNTPESELQLLPTNLDGCRCIELGCGAGYVSSWMARRDGQVVGIDPAANQLKTASRLEEQYQLGIEFVEGFCEALPFPDSCFDFAISEYGASLWANPFRWIPEASRVLKTGGRLVFMTDHAFAVCCVPDDGNWRAPMSERLLRPYHGLFKHQWNSSSHEVEFHLSHGDWVQLLRDNNFVIERLVEVGATAKSSSRFGYADANWASKWPAEEVWCARLSA